MKASSAIKFVAILLVITLPAFSRLTHRMMKQNSDFVRVFNSGVNTNHSCYGFSQTQEITKVCNSNAEKIMFECERFHAHEACGKISQSFDRLFKSRCDVGSRPHNQYSNRILKCRSDRIHGFDKWLGEENDEPNRECKVAAKEDIESKMRDCGLRNDAARDN